MLEMKNEDIRIPNDLIIQMLRGILFKEQNNKYILTNFSDKSKHVIIINY